MITDIVSDLITDYIDDIIEIEDSIMFSARVSATIPNVTGDGTNYTIIFDDDTINIGSHYNPITGIFTAPVTGLYTFYTNQWLRAINVAHTSGLAFIATTTQLIRIYQGNPGVEKGAASDMSINGAVLVKLTATDTVSSQISIAAFTKTIDVSNIGETIFGGQLIRKL